MRLNRGVLCSSNQLPWPPSRDPCSVSSGPDQPHRGSGAVPLSPRVRGRAAITAAAGLEPLDRGVQARRGSRQPFPSGGMGLPQGRGNASERKDKVPCRGSRRDGKGQTDKQTDRYGWGEDAPTAVFCLGVNDPHCSSTWRREEINCNQLIINPV